METLFILINSASFIYFLYFTIQYIKYFRFTFLILIPIYLSQFWLICSVYYFDLGDVYTFESEITSSVSLSTTFLIGGNLLFFSILKYKLIKLNFFKNTQIDKLNLFKKQSNILFDLILIVVILFNAAILINMLTVGVPILTGVNRSDYAINLLDTPILSLVYKHYLTTVFFLGILLAKSLKQGYRRPVIILLIIFVFVLSLLEGNKFSRLLDISILLCTPPILLGLFNRLNRKLVIYILISLAVFFISIISYHSTTFSYLLEASPSGTITGYLFQRFFVLQGGIWWKSFDIIVTQGVFNFSHLQLEFQNIYSSVQGFTGLKHLMDFTSGGNFVTKLLYSDTEYQFSGGSPAIFLVTFGPILYWVVIAFIAYIFSYFIYFIKKFILTNNLVILFFFITFYQTFQNLYLSGNFDAFFILGNLFRFFIILFLLLIFSHYRVSTKK